MLLEVVKIHTLDNEQKKEIGFVYILEKLEPLTPYGNEKKKNIKVFKEKRELIEELNNTEKIINSIKKQGVFYNNIERLLAKFKDIRNTLKRCGNEEILDDIELYEIKYFCICLENLIKDLDGLNLDIEKIKFNSLEKVILLLDPEGKKIPTFYIYDAYSGKLKELREKKRNIENMIFNEINLEKIDELKEERLQVVILEGEEELNIRSELTMEIGKFINQINGNIEALTELDFLIAKGRLIIELNGIKPQISDKMEISLKDMFNPQIKQLLNSKKKDFTPVSIDLNSGTSVITGANMGGKTITLKTLVLNLFLGQIGFYVFCKEAVFPLLDFIYFISDDMQSISKGLSTFGAEIIELKSVVKHVKQGRGFIALDEFARGTNPKEGLYLVKALCQYLNDFDSISLISTHYDGVVEENMTHYQVKGLKNVDYESLKTKIYLDKEHSVQILQEHMDYTLEKVSKESSVPEDALNICILLGLEDEIVKKARGFYKK